MRILMVVAAFVVQLFLVSIANADNGYYRYPASNGRILVFSSEGDLWRLAHGDLQATRLTTHIGWEGQAHLSPDGTMIAFAASFDANQQVYIMPLSGGTPRQLTYEISRVSVRGWSPDGRVLYTSRDISGASRSRELRLVDPANSSITRIPLGYATTGTFDEDGGNLFFVRHGISTVGDNARLYRGGGTAQLWRYETGSDDEAVRLATDFDGPIDNPMFWRERVYFISDQSGWDNIWSMDVNGEDVHRHTEFATWRLQGATMRDGIIHYQRGADIYAYDINSATQQMITIDLASDNDRSRLRWIEDPMAYIEDASLGAKNRRVALTARGHVMIAGPGEERRVELTFPADARAREALLDHKGKWVYVILGQDESSEIWRFAADGSGQGQQLTRDARHHRWRMTLSPDGKHLMHTDKARGLYALNVKTGKNRLLYESDDPDDDPSRVTGFSQGGRYMAFSTYLAGTSIQVVKIVDMESDEIINVSGTKYSSHSAQFSPDGNWLYFISERNFVATPGHPWRDRSMGVMFDKRSQVFALGLNKDARFPFLSPTELDPEEANDESDGEDSKKASRTRERIDWTQAMGRLHQVPVPAGNYDQLAVNGERLYLLEAASDASNLKTLEITHDDAKLEGFLESINDFSLSADGKTLMVRFDGTEQTVAIIPADAEPPEDIEKHTVRTAGWRMALDPGSEWQQQFLDGWRMHRDFSFDPKMRGVNWTDVRDQLLPLAARIGHRTELDNLFGQMAYPLGILHSQVFSGDTPRDQENGTMASLAAHYQPVKGGIKITHIYAHEFDRPETAGPLKAPGTDVQVGDLITHINRQSIATLGDVSLALMHQAGEQVLLDLRRGRKSLQQIVVPVAPRQEYRLKYQDWTLSNAANVSRISQGEIGYLHLRAMGPADVASFARDFFAQSHVDGIIIDVRDNNGGSVDSILLTQLLRNVWAFWGDNENKYPQGNMQRAYRGHLAILVNAGTYSDGDTFAAGVKTLGLAPLIGERTAGAGIWLTGRNNLSDGGRARIAEFAQFNLDGEWLIEGRGVSPDIEIVAGPHALFKGDDAQINAAVKYLQRKIKDQPVPELRIRPLPPAGEHGVDAKPR